jgi:putative Holliday junction resolvase
MPRILALDYGTKRVGVAVTDELQIIASGLTTVHSSDLIQFITDYIQKEKVETIVVGEPKTLSNEKTDSSHEIEKLMKNLVKKFPNQKIDKMDERFTSKLAKQAILMSGAKKKKRQQKELVDEVSATIILQSYMQMNENRMF